jgi:hypothetical protein
MILTKDNILIDDIGVDFEDNVGGGLVIKQSQEIPEEHLDALRIAKADTIGTPMGELHRVCSVPTNLVEKWMREGFNIYDKNVTPQEVLKRLRQEQLDTFITTTKRI